MRVIVNTRLEYCQILDEHVVQGKYDIIMQFMLRQELKSIIL